MKYASDYRNIAYGALWGNWMMAVLAGFIAFLMGAAGSSLSLNGMLSDDQLQVLRANPSWPQIYPILLTVLIIYFVWTIIKFVISGAAYFGYIKFNLKLVDGENATLSDLFSQFHRLGDGICMNILLNLFISLWSLLFFIPGFIKEYSYAMTPYIMAENPNITVTEAITRSRHMMYGNKWRLFCLDFSFIGWTLLCNLPFMIAAVVLGVNAVHNTDISVLLHIIPFLLISFIASLFLIPYQSAARAAFYRDIAGHPTQQS